MPPDDLYAALGVPKDATPEQVNRAFRSRARKAHPDAGGAKEAFHALVRARDVLSDKERRERYDRTGDAGEAEVDNAVAEAQMIVMRTLRGVCDKLGDDVFFFDAIDSARREISQGVGETQNDIKNVRKHVERMRKIAARVHAKKGRTNLIATMFENDACDKERHVADAERHIEKLKKAIAILDGHTFEKDARKEMSQDQFVMLGPGIGRMYGFGRG